MLGNQFDETVVSAMLDDDSAAIDTGAALQASAAAETVEHRWGTTWAFNHALYRDTAYAGLPFSLRRRLHRDAATIIEERSADLSAAAPVLSLHYAAARSYAQAWRYSLIAAQAAEAQHARRRCGDRGTERALAAGRPGPRTSHRRSEVRLRNDSVTCRTSSASSIAPATAFRLARRINDDPVVEKSRWCARSARCANGRVDRTAPSAGTSGLLAPFRPMLVDRGVGGGPSRRCPRRGRHSSPHGRQLRCLDLAIDALTNARDASDRRIEALALERIHLALTYLRRPDVGRRRVRWHWRPTASSRTTAGWLAR